MSATRPSLRERKKQETRESLAQAAMRLFLDRGYDNVTVDDIVEACGVSQRTFFRYFPTKESVVFRNHERRLQLFSANLRKERDAGNTIEAVLQSLLATAAAYNDWRNELLLEWEIVVASAALIARDLELDFEYEQAIADRLLDSNNPNPISPEVARVLAGAIFGVVRAIMTEWYDRRCTENLVELGSKRIDTLVSGVRDAFLPVFDG